MNKKTKTYAKLKQKLNYHYRYFDKTKISPDPLELPRQYSNFYDIESSAFIASVFAYGSVGQIMTTLNKIKSIYGESPHEFIMNYSIKNGKKIFRDIKHRFFTSEDIVHLFHILHRVYSTYGSLHYLFMMYYFEKDMNLKNAISFFSRNLLCINDDCDELSQGMKFMFPDPMKGSAAKRMNLFLRWMIRKDELDFGLWPEIPTDKLVIPVDTHVAKICKELKLTKRETVNWLMAEEITENLKLFNPKDPVKYDFAICHIGMRQMKF